MNEVQELRNTLEAFESLKKHDEEGMLNDIAEELSITYKQMKGSENAEMTAELGEIYRQMLKRVFKTLDKNGIKMDR